MTLQRLLSKSGKVDKLQKLLACTLFEALSPEERSQLTSEKAMFDVIAHVVSKPEPASDGRIPDGGRQTRPFLHLYRSMEVDDSGFVASEQPRDPDACPVEFPIMEVPDKLLDPDNGLYVEPKRIHKMSQGCKAASLPSDQAQRRRRPRE